MADFNHLQVSQTAAAKNLVRGNSVATLSQIYQHQNSIPARNRILNTAKSLQQASVDIQDNCNAPPTAGSVSGSQSLVSQQQQQPLFGAASLLAAAAARLTSHQQQPKQQQHPPAPHLSSSSFVRIINVAQRHKRHSGGMAATLDQYDSSYSGSLASQSNFQAQLSSQTRAAQRRAASTWSTDSSDCSSPPASTSPIHSNTNTSTSSNNHKSIGVGQGASSSIAPSQQVPTPAPPTSQRLPLGASLGFTVGLARSPSPSSSRAKSTTSGEQPACEPAPSSPSQSPVLSLPPSGASSPRRRILPQIGGGATAAPSQPAAVSTLEFKLATKPADNPSVQQQPSNALGAQRHRKLPQIPMRQQQQQQQQQPVPGVFQRALCLALAQDVIPPLQSLSSGSAASISGGQHQPKQPPHLAGQQLRVQSFPMPSSQPVVEQPSIQQKQHQQQRPSGCAGETGNGSQISWASSSKSSCGSGSGSTDTASPRSPIQLARHSSYQPQSLTRQRLASSSSSSSSPVVTNAPATVAKTTATAASPAHSDHNNKSPSYLAGCKTGKHFTFAEMANVCVPAANNEQLEANFACFSPGGTQTGTALGGRPKGAPSKGEQLDQQQREQLAASLASAGRGRRLSTCGSGLRANFLMNKQHAISDFTPPRSLESSTSRGSADWSQHQWPQPGGPLMGAAEGAADQVTQVAGFCTPPVPVQATTGQLQQLQQQVWSSTAPATGSGGGPLAPQARASSAQSVARLAAGAALLATPTREAGLAADAPTALRVRSVSSADGGSCPIVGAPRPQPCARRTHHEPGLPPRAASATEPAQGALLSSANLSQPLGASRLSPMATRSMTAVPAAAASTGSRLSTSTSPHHHYHSHQQQQQPQQLLGLPIIQRDRQPSNVSTASMPATSGGSPLSASVAPTSIQTQIPPQLSTSGTSSGPKFGAWAERIAARNSAAQAFLPGNRTGAGLLVARARSATQLEAPLPAGRALQRAVKGSRSSSDSSSSSRLTSASSSSSLSSSSFSSSSASYSSASRSSSCGLFLGDANDRLTPADKRHLVRVRKRRPSSAASTQRPHRARRRRRRGRRRGGSPSAEAPDKDQLTLSDRLKIAQRSANKLFRKVELSPQSQPSKQNSGESSLSPYSPAAGGFFSGQTLFPVQSQAQQESTVGGQQQADYLQPGGNDAAGRQQRAGSALQLKATLTSGGGDSNEFADDEQGDDLSLFLLSVDRQRRELEQRRSGAKLGAERTSSLGPASAFGGADGGQRAASCSLEAPLPSHSTLAAGFDTSGAGGGNCTTATASWSPSAANAAAHQQRPRLGLPITSGSSQEAADPLPVGYSCRRQLSAAKKLQRAITLRSLVKNLSRRASSLDQAPIAAGQGCSRGQQHESHGDQPEVRFPHLLSVAATARARRSAECLVLGGGAKNGSAADNTLGGQRGERATSVKRKAAQLFRRTRTLVSLGNSNQVEADSRAPSSGQVELARRKSSGAELGEQHSRAGKQRMQHKCKDDGLGGHGDEDEAQVARMARMKSVIAAVSRRLEPLRGMRAHKLSSGASGSGNGSGNESASARAGPRQRQQSEDSNAANNYNDNPRASATTQIAFQ